ncbi:MarR family winged helix-turn-helix transcriptional regulator [Paracoccus ravus]|uniref:MarR family winged helix-turn-helix transcriptional regulator n=1 Tax=Paracoccus ravus TaxID=2447760 RepID=UPI00106EEC83|nr:MarR family transcriptional regulator [Paracoccus ravus]
MRAPEDVPSEDSGPANLLGEGRMRPQWPFYWISRVNQRYAETLQARLKHLDLDVSRWRVLMSLHEDDLLSVSEIAEYAVLKLSTTTKIVQRLVADGMVTTQPRASDARVTEVRLTDEGDRIRRLARAQAEAVFARAFTVEATDELAGLNELLEKVFTRLNDADTPARRARRERDQ